jgi:hypothetical protein
VSGATSVAQRLEQIGIHEILRPADGSLVRDRQLPSADHQDPESAPKASSADRTRAALTASAPVMDGHRSRSDTRTARSTSAIAAAALTLVDNSLLLPDDVPDAIRRAAAHYEWRRRGVRRDGQATAVLLVPDAFK